MSRKRGFLIQPLVGFACMISPLLIVQVVGGEPSPEEVIARTWIPSANSIHGETRILHRGNELVIQTILHSTSFRRGIKEIITKETAVWNERRTGFADSQRYCEELDKVKQRILEEPRQESDTGKPYTLLMEFIFHPQTSRISFWQAEVEKLDDTFLVKSSSLLSQIDVSDAYMSRAMLMMATAAFSQERNDIRSLLTNAGWRDLHPSLDANTPLMVR